MPSADRLSLGQQAHIFSMLPGNLLFRVEHQSPQRVLKVDPVDRISPVSDTTNSRLRTGIAFALLMSTMETEDLYAKPGIFRFFFPEKHAYF